MEATMKFVTGMLSALALIALLASPAHSQSGSSETFVASFGNDSNSCDRTSPCRSFNGAIAKTSGHGVINCVDSFSLLGPVNVDRSVTIDCQAVHNRTESNGSAGVAINFDSFLGSDTRKTVRLRNFTVSGTDIGAGGIVITGSATGTTVVIEDCVIDGNIVSGQTDRGIDDRRSGGGKLFVTNTTISNNAGAGISVLPASGASNIQVLLNNVRAYNNGTGAQFGNLVRALIDQSAFSGNTGAGILTVAGAIVDVDRSTVSHNANGIQALGGVVSLANSNIKLNTSQGINTSGGTVFSFGNNRIAFNASPGTAPSPAGAVSNDLGQQ
jgi:hypothetical protein